MFRLVRPVVFAAALACALGATARAQLLMSPGKLTASPPSASNPNYGVADVDQDGVLDLLSTAAGAIVWQKGNGLGGFAGATTTLPTLGGQFLHTTDLNGDGRYDAIVGSFATSMQVALGQAGGGFQSPAVVFNPSTSISGRTISSADADGDGDRDVLVVTSPMAAFGGEARLYLNDGAGGLTQGPVISGTVSVPVIGGVAASINGDADPDLVVVTQTGATASSTVWLGQPGGGMASGYVVPDLAVVRAADLDSDGDLDLLAPITTLSAPVSVYTFLGDGRGQFTAGPTTDLGVVIFGVVSSELSDFDGDGTLDLAVIVPGTPPEAWTLHGDGTGAFDAPDAHVSLLGALGTSASARLGPCVDFDSDGRVDASFAITQPFQASFSVTLNATYPRGGALLDLGHQLKGNNGWPIQIATGSFVGGTHFSFTLANGPISKPVMHILGFSVLNAPFKGGTLVPTPNVFSGPWITNSSGALTLAGNWPMGVPSGFTLALQFWFASSGSPTGVGASSGLLLTTP